MPNQQLSGTALTSLFLQSTLQDELADYKKSLTVSNFPHWDAVVITASDNAQAQGYNQQLAYRKAAGLLPLNTRFLVVPDEGGVRVGSGGSTLSVIRQLKQLYGDFDSKRFLCIHAGGASQRCPQYSALGKLFSPVPALIDGNAATLFDMFLLTMASVPGRIKDGLVCLSGDVILLMNPLMLELSGADSAIVTFKESARTAKNHGVCLRDESTGHVQQFLHKLSEEDLQAKGAVDQRGNCNIDTGAVYLGVKVLQQLYALVEKPADYRAMVNDKVRLSLYGDINYALSDAATLDTLQQQTPEGDFCPELTAARQRLWQAIGSFSMRCLTLAPAKFVHFGSIPEILKLMQTGIQDYAALGWCRQIKSAVKDSSVAAYQSILSRNSTVGEGCYLEYAHIHSGVTVGNNCYLSFVELHKGTVIPDNLLLHCLKLNNGKYVCRIMGVGDNPKTAVLFGCDFAQIIRNLRIDPADIWPQGATQTLWNARLYPQCESMQQAISAALTLFKLVSGAETSLVLPWLASERLSLSGSFALADPSAIIDYLTRLRDLVKMEELKHLVQSARPAKEAADILQAQVLSVAQQGWVEAELQRKDLTVLPDFSYAMRLLYYLYAATGDEAYKIRCFKMLADGVLHTATKQLTYNENAVIVQEKTVVRLPLRVNWGGGWSDTCPHCMENGGAVLNAAITLNGEYPVTVRLHKIPQLKVIFRSDDMGVYGEFDSIEQLQATGDPYDPFALQKACLLACGIIPKQGGNLQQILARLGGGFEMDSEVTNVPKGSGLGTSSILSAAAVKAMLTFTGVTYTEDMLYSVVLAMEQLMSTGGGWQDQVGGLTPGIKLVTSAPGAEQKLSVQHITLSEKAKAELSRRFAVIYTGQRRLARNLLRDVVGSYLGNDPDSIFAHREIQKVAYQMKAALENGDIDQFARLLDYHWSLSKKIDRDSTNTLIEQIFMSIEDLIDAKMCCGAGGGGFLQVVLKKDVTKAQLHERLKAVFQDFPVDVWDAELLVTD